MYNIDMRLKEKLCKLFDLLSAKDCKCIVCNREIHRDSKYCMCDKCRESLPAVKNPCAKCGGDIPSGVACLNCKSKPPIFEKTVVAYNYIPPISPLIYRLKYENAKYLAPYLGEMLVDTFLENNFDIDYIVPVPIHPNRRKERGYNQVELLLPAFDNLNIPYKLSVVERTIDTPHQTDLPRKERLHNLENAFKVIDKSQVKGKSILIIDDVYTTGSTLNELASVLYSAKAKTVYCLVIAHGEIKILTEKNT